MKTENILNYLYDEEKNSEKLSWAVGMFENRVLLILLTEKVILPRKARKKALKEKLIVSAGFTERFKLFHWMHSSLSPQRKESRLIRISFRFWLYSFSRQQSQENAVARRKVVIIFLIFWFLDKKNKLIRSVNVVGLSWLKCKKWMWKKSCCLACCFY